MLIEGPGVNFRFSRGWRVHRFRHSSPCRVGVKYSLSGKSGAQRSIPICARLPRRSAPRRNSRLSRRLPLSGSNTRNPRRHRTTQPALAHLPAPKNAARCAALNSPCMRTQLLSLLAHNLDRTTIHQEEVGWGCPKLSDLPVLFVCLLVVAKNATAQSDYQVLSLSSPGTIAGTVKWSGALPRIPTFTINKDPEICDPESHKTRDLERLIVGPQGGVANTVVFLRNISRGKAMDLPEPRRSLDQKHCRYEPHILLVSQSAVLRMKSSDATLHTVHMDGAALTICPSPSPTRSFLVQCPQQGWLT